MSIDKKIEWQKQIVPKAKNKYDSAVAEPEMLMKKRKELLKKELVAAITASNKSFDEIMAYCRQPVLENDWAIHRELIFQKFSFINNFLDKTCNLICSISLIVDWFSIQIRIYFY